MRWLDEALIAGVDMLEKFIVNHCAQAKSEEFGRDAKDEQETIGIH